MKCLEGQYHKSIRAFIPSWLDATPEALGPCRFNLEEPACLAHVWEQWLKQNQLAAFSCAYAAKVLA